MTFESRYGYISLELSNGLKFESSLNDILISMLKNPKVSNLIECLSMTDIYTSHHNDGIWNYLSTYSNKMKSNTIEPTRNDGQREFNYYVEASTKFGDLSVHGTRLNIISQANVAIAFDHDDTCELFTKTYHGTISRFEFTLNELDIILRVICAIKGIQPPLIPIKYKTFSQPEVTEFRILLKIHECFFGANSIINRHVNQLTSTSAFYLICWGKYGSSMLTGMILVLTSNLYNNLFNNEKLVAVASMNNFQLVNKFQVISVKRAYDTINDDKKRYQLHLILRLPSTELKATTTTNSEVSNVSNTNDLKSLISRFETLPTELKEQITNDRVNFNLLKCSCSSLSCAQEIHNSKCSKRTSLINDTMNLLFPISQRNSLNSHGQRFCDVYVIYTTILNNGYEFFFCNGPPTQASYNLGSTNLKDRSKLKVMNREHFQGKVLNMNEPVHSSLRIEDSDFTEFDASNCNNLSKIQNNYYDDTSSFKPIQLNCPHSEQFIPKMHGNGIHYLLFD